MSYSLFSKDLVEKPARRGTEEGQKDKNGKPRKYPRDLESDWTILNEAPHYGIKERTAVDARHGFVLAIIHSSASFHDINFL